MFDTKKIQKIFVQSKRGASIIEVLVVLVIFALVAALGFEAISRFRSTADFDSTVSSFDSTLLTVQNNARNNVVSRANVENTNQIPDPDVDGVDELQSLFDYKIAGYLIFFVDEYYEVRSCTINAMGIYNCSSIEPNLDRKSPNIAIKPNGNCAGVFFKNLNGEIKLLNPSLGGQRSSLAAISPSTSMTIKTCDVSVTHEEAQKNTVFSFSVDQNNYVRQNALPTKN